MPADRPTGNWLAHNLPWSNRWSDWQERLFGLGIALIALAQVILTAQYVSFWPAVAGWSAFAVLLGFVSWQGWYKLFGPVLFYDMVRTARRSRYMVLRLFYGGFLLFVLCYLYLVLWMMSNFNLNGQMNEGMERRAMAMLSESFFGFFMLLQMVIVIILTPAYVAGAIADEKDRKTMEFILATDLRDREIIFSKLLARLANMALLLVTGLPIMSLMQFLGGIDPDLMLAGYACIGLTMLGLGGLSILFSTLFKRPRDAISLTYLLMISYVAVALTGYFLSMAPLPIMSFPLWFNDDPPTLRSLIHHLNAGNPLTMVINVWMAILGRRMNGGATTLAAELPGILRGYTGFHLTLATICITWSIFRLRIALKQTTAGTTVKLSWWQKLRPAVGSYPMLWKELYVEGQTKLNWLMWIAVITLVVITVGSGLWVLGYFLWEVFFNGNERFWRDIPEAMNIWFRIAGTFVGCLMFLMLGVRASTCISHERERDTFDTLLTTPMSAEAMLTAKFLGNLTSLRIGWLWFGSMLALAVFTGGVHPLALPILIGACAIYSIFVTMVGLWFSIYCKSSLQAALGTVLSILFFGGAHWVVTGCCLMPLFGAMMALAFNRLNDPAINKIVEKTGEYFVKAQAGITPPFVLAFNAFSWEQFSRNWQNDRNFWEFVAFSVFGLFFFAVISMLFWFFILMPMFRRQTRRIELEDQPH